MLRVTDAAQVIPGRCFICERQFEDGESAVNTTFTYSPDWDTKLFGNKMVCDNCVHDIAETAGYEDGLKVSQKINSLVEQHATDLAAAQEALDAAQSVGVDAEALAQRVVELMKPKPRPRSANAKSTA